MLKYLERQTVFGSQSLATGQHQSVTRPVECSSFNKVQFIIDIGIWSGTDRALTVKIFSYDRLLNKSWEIDEWASITGSGTYFEEYVTGVYDQLWVQLTFVNTTSAPIHMIAVKKT